MNFSTYVQYIFQVIHWFPLILFVFFDISLEFYVFLYISHISLGFLEIPGNSEAFSDGFQGFLGIIDICEESTAIYYIESHWDFIESHWNFIGIHLNLLGIHWEVIEIYWDSIEIY